MEVKEKMSKSVFIPCDDGYYYKLAKGESIRTVCILSSLGERYTVYPDRYIIGLDGYMYEIAYSGDMNTTQRLGKDFQKYLVKAQPIPIKDFRDVEELKKYLCLQVNPPPKIELDGEGEVDCSRETGICFTNAPKNSKVSMRAPNHYKKLFDRNKGWLK